MAGKVLVSATCTSQLMAIDINKLQQIFCSNETKLMEAIGYYNTLKRELKFMKDNIEGLIKNLEEAQVKVDKVHKRANVTVIASSATSILGGALFIGGLIAAPFTLGASIGLSVAGGLVSVGSATANLSAQIADAGYGEYSKRKTEEKINKFLSHYNEAQAAYNNLLRICNILCSLTWPEYKAEEKRGFVDQTLEMGCTIIEHAWKLKFSALGTAASVRSCGYTTYMAATAPRVLQKDLDVIKQSQALLDANSSPKVGKVEYILRKVPLESAITKAGSIVLQSPGRLIFSKVGKVLLPTESAIKKAGLTVLRSSGPLMKLGAGALTLIGIAVDIYTVCTTAYNLYKNKKTEVSENISKHIENLKTMQQQLYVLNEQIELIDSKITTSSCIANIDELPNN